MSTRPGILAAASTRQSRPRSCVSFSRWIRRRDWWSHTAGSITRAGNKNAALPIMAAALLTEHPVTLRNVPRIRDTEILAELIGSVGAAIEWRDHNTLAIQAKSLRAADLDPALCARIRASI